MVYKYVPSNTSLFVFAQFQELSCLVFLFRCQLMEWRSSCVGVKCQLPRLIIICRYSWHLALVLIYFALRFYALTRYFVKSQRH